MEKTDTALVKQIFDISKRERESDTHHHAKLDDLGRGFEVAEWVLSHFTRLIALPDRLKPVCADNDSRRSGLALNGCTSGRHLWFQTFDTEHFGKSALVVFLQSCGVHDFPSELRNLTVLHLLMRRRRLHQTEVG